jgi:hypothetical protein
MKSNLLTTTDRQDALVLEAAGARLATALVTYLELAGGIDAVERLAKVQIPVRSRPARGVQSLRDAGIELP